MRSITFSVLKCADIHCDKYAMYVMYILGKVHAYLCATHMRKARKAARS